MRLPYLLILCALLNHSPSLSATDAPTCPVTLGSSTTEGAPFEGMPWYRRGTLAASVPLDGIWPTTNPDHAIAVKLWWWSDNYQAGMESDLDVRFESLLGQPQSPKQSEVTHSYGDRLDAPWAMLVGIDFPQPGCWKVIGTFRDASLEFVVNVIDHHDYGAK